MTLFQGGAVGATFAAFGINAVYTPSGGDPILVRVMREIHLPSEPTVSKHAFVLDVAAQKPVPLPPQAHHPLISSKAWLQCQTACNLDPRLECAPGAGQDSGRCFDRLPGVVVLELGGAQIAEG